MPTEPTHCPKCNANLDETDATYYDAIESDEGVAWHRVACSVCDCRFDLTYQYTGFTIVTD